MTTVVMVQRDGDVELGWDSLATQGNEQSSMVAPKVFVNNGVIYGVSGGLLVRNAFEYGEFPSYQGGDPMRWLVTKWVPVVKKMIEDEPKIGWEEDGSLPWSALIVVGGQAFDIDLTLSPYQSQSGIYAIGSGSSYALGALYAGVDVMEALHVAAKVDAFTGGPMTVCWASKYLKAHRPVGLPQPSPAEAVMTDLVQASWEW